MSFQINIIMIHGLGSVLGDGLRALVAQVVVWSAREVNDLGSNHTKIIGDDQNIMMEHHKLSIIFEQNIIEHHFERTHVEYMYTVNILYLQWHATYICKLNLQDI